MVTRYKGVHPNNNNRNNRNNRNNNHVALINLFPPSTLHELRQLGLYTNTDTLDTAQQLDVEVVAAEVTYTMTNTHPSCSGGGESDRIPNTFKEIMDLSHVARWKAASSKEILCLEN